MVAIGGDLSSERLLQAYRQGIFPWFSEGYPILWWSPAPRMLLKPDQFVVSRSLKRSLKIPHQLRVDTDFASVISRCASANHRAGQTWITKEMQEAYCQLYDQGYAHSFEIWSAENELIGGLYGISLGRAFFGESMFHIQRDASKMAFYYLCQTLQQWQFDFIDCQLPSEHLETLGAKPLSRDQFLSKLAKTLKHPDLCGQWTKRIK